MKRVWPSSPDERSRESVDIALRYLRPPRPPPHLLADFAPLYITPCPEGIGKTDTSDRFTHFEAHASEMPISGARWSIGRRWQRSTMRSRLKTRVGQYGGTRGQILSPRTACPSCCLRTTGVSSASCPATPSRRPPAPVRTGPTSGNPGIAGHHIRSQRPVRKARKGRERDLRSDRSRSPFLLTAAERQP